MKFSILEPLVDNFRRQQIITVKRSLGMGNISAVLALSEHGRERAQECLASCHYAGTAPVPIDQYTKMVHAQKLPDSWLTMDKLKAAYGHMVVTDELLGQIGPAVNSGKSFLIYGQPGNGKLFFQNLDEAAAFVTMPLPNCHALAVHPFGTRLVVSATNGNSSGNGRPKSKNADYPGNFSPLHVFDFPKPQK